MKCPYCVDGESVSQVVLEYNEDNLVSGETRVENRTIKLHNCLEEKCGAWRDGRCGYVGAVN